jgi:hypothetical protein
MAAKRNIDRRNDGLPLEMISESSSEYDDDLDELDNGDVPKPPAHPVLSMQGPFEESMWEAEHPDANENAQARANPKVNAKARHQRLLENKNFNDSYNARWRRSPRSKYHPMSKIIAQLVFGIHLLHGQLAKSDEEVVNILQRHVDEVDTFIQNAGEDFDHTLADIKERINYLKLPLEHVNIFDIMLDDKIFRTQIIEGNEKIEQIVARTADLMNDLLVDVSKGQESTKEMAEYLDDLEDDWPDDPNGSVEIYETMRSNAEGWMECFRDLQMKGNSLGVALVQLGSILNEMSKRAGVASRRSVPNSRPGSSKSEQARNIRFKQHPQQQAKSRFSRSAAKPLPDDPDLVARAVQDTLPKRNPIPLEERWEHPRSQPRPPVKKPSPVNENASGKKLNPETAHLTTFFRDTGPDTTPEVTPYRENTLEDVVPDITALPQRPKDEKKDEKPGIVQRTRSRLRQRSHDVLSDKSKSPIDSDRSRPREPSNSSSVPDSAYSSGSNDTTANHGERRPSTSPEPVTVGALAPAPRTPSTPNARFSLFPSATNSAMASEISLPLHGRPVAPAPQVHARRDSAPSSSSGSMKRSGSLKALKRIFSRKKVARRGALDVVQENA